MLAQELRRNRHLTSIEIAHNNASPEAMYEVSKLVHRNEDKQRMKKEKRERLRVQQEEEALAAQQEL